MRAMSLLVLAAALLAPSAAAQTPPRADDERRAAEAALARFTSPMLMRFSGDVEFQNYVDAVRLAARARGEWWASLDRLRFAQAATAPDVQSDAAIPFCTDEDLECVPIASGEDRSITVTGSRIQPRNASITNNQMRGVEEGDIVKQIDHFLLVLQDGRIFVVDTRAGGRRLALADRADVYRDPKSDMWYDEMLVFGDRVLVAGYSYDESETELAVFRLGPTGRLAREGVFRLSSNDYYSSNNYSTRLIGDTLVTYSPISVSDLSRSDFQWPVVRRWRGANEPPAGEERAGPGRPLLDAWSIYRPVRTSLDPFVHTVSVCPLGAIARTGELECRTTAFAGLRAVQWYVTNSDVYLWLSAEGEIEDRDDCAPGRIHGLADSVPGLLYRVPVSGAAPKVAGALGSPPDQFAMQADARNFHALLRLESPHCYEDYESPTRVALLTMPLSRLSDTVEDLPATAYTPLPGLHSHYIASRFTERHLVYGGLSNARRGPAQYDEADADQPWVRRARAEPGRPAYALALARPKGVKPLALGHSVIRAERVGDDILLTGYRDRDGLSLSLVGLDGDPRIAAQTRLEGRYESEGRSHAFNSLVESDGTALMGLPTVGRICDSNRDYWRSRASDLSFLRLDEDRRLVPIGRLERRFDYEDNESGEEEDEDGVPGYECEVSCVDWYGNSRPIFTDGRIFALSGTELIEGRLEKGRIREVQRLNIALSPPAR